jgi:hypothetical protein
MTSVFIVRNDDYDDTHVYAVLTSRKSADNWAKSYKKVTPYFSPEIEEMDIIEGEDIQFVTVYRVVLFDGHVDGTYALHDAVPSRIIPEGADIPADVISYGVGEYKHFHAEIFGLTVEEVKDKAEILLAAEKAKKTAE